MGIQGARRSEAEAWAFRETPLAAVLFPIFFSESPHAGDGGVQQRA